MVKKWIWDGVCLHFATLWSTLYFVFCVFYFWHSSWHWGSLEGAHFFPWKITNVVWKEGSLWTRPRFSLTTLRTEKGVTVSLNRTKTKMNPHLWIHVILRHVSMYTSASQVKGHKLYLNIFLCLQTLNVKNKLKWGHMYSTWELQWLLTGLTSVLTRLQVYSKQPTAKLDRFVVLWAKCSPLLEKQDRSCNYFWLNTI